MPELTIPFIGPITTRTIDPWSASSKDQVFKNCLFSSASNEAAAERIIYIEKRPGWETQSTPASGAKGTAVYQTVFDGSRSMISVFGTTSVTFYLNTTAVGTATFTGNLTSVLISETVFNGIKYVLFGCSGAIYYLAAGSTSVGFTFTGDTHTNTTIDNISSMDGLFVGQLLSGTGIQAGTRIATINVAGTSITTTLATTATNAGITITREAIAKIIDSDLPSNVSGQVVAMDGYLFTGTNDGKIYNSNLNSLLEWSANDYITTSFSSAVGATSEPFGVWRVKQYIVAIGYQNIEWFVNTGNPSDSVLSRVPGSSLNIGANSIKGVASINDNVYFVSSEAFGTNGVYVVGDTSVKKVSDQIIDNILGSVSSSNTSSLSAFKFAGNDCLVLTVLENSAYRSFIYFQNSNIWFEWDGSIPWTITPPQSAHFNQGFSSLGNAELYAVSNLLTAGKIYKMVMREPVYQDDGSAFTMTAQTQPYYLNNGKPFLIDWIDVICDTQASGSSTVSASGDDYANFDTLGTIDLTSQLKRIQPGGRYESSVAFKLTDAGNQAWRGQALKVHWTPCQ